MPTLNLNLRKMQHSFDSHQGVVKLLKYKLAEIELNDLVGQTIQIAFQGKINCVHCGRQIKKTFGDGYCFPCSQKLAACDLCILKPELCHFRHGTCREPQWAKVNCLIDHVVYLSNTTGLKVGISRCFKRFERWGDQGALEAIVLAVVPERYIAGLIEVELSQHLADKTDWRALLKGQEFKLDLLSEKQKAVGLISEQYKQYLISDGELAQLFKFSYPVKQYLAKALTFNFDKQVSIQGVLNGIRGQYLLIDNQALNIRKFSGYQVQVSF